MQLDEEFGNAPVDILRPVVGMEGLG